MRANTMIRFLAAPALVLLAACESATAGSGDARMQMAAAGDDGSTLSRAEGDGPRYASSSAQGTVSFEARAYVQTSAGAWIELTDGAFEQVGVTASSTRASAQAFATENVAATSYTRVRLVFREVDADVNGGVTLGGSAFTGTLTVNAGSDGEITVERAISVNAQAGATTRLLLDLNSNLWLSQASATSRSVAEAAFASAVSVAAY